MTSNFENLTKGSPEAVELEESKLSAAESQDSINDKVIINISIMPVVNYALQQNRLPVIQSISIVNNSSKALEKINLSITAAPELCLPFNSYIEYIPQESTYDIKGARLILNGEYLAGLTEKITGFLHITLSAEDTLLYSEKIEITALAYDEWHGYGYHPEMLTAFITPNHPEVIKLISRAADLLGKWTGDPSLDGYQSKDSNRVISQAAAIFGALQEQNIIYAVPPASFEAIGQRVRLCDAVIQQKMGTCLDLTLLYAACLEAAGLHPLLILKKDHILPGVWLEELSFPEPVQYDGSLITKKLSSGINELAIVESTLFVSGKNAAFDDARMIAAGMVSATDAVECIIDVKRARLSGIVPLPQRIQTDTGWYISRAAVEEKGITVPPEDLDETIIIDEMKSGDKASKKTQWERKLLDLGLRNTLINTHFSKTMIPILATSLDELENALSNNSDFSILPRPADWHISGEAINFETMRDYGMSRELIKSEFHNKRLRSTLTEGELTAAIKALYRGSKTALEENGANSLYLVLGLLRWYETDRSTKERYAPIVMLPIEIIRKSANRGYVIRLRDEEPQINITMLEKLKQDFGIIVNGLDPLPQDDYGIDIRRVFAILRKAIMEQSRWDVIESASLGIFSFSQFVMWNDIRNRSEDLSRNKIVRSLMDGRLAWDAEEMRIEDRVPEGRVFLPMAADASQLYAIEEASQGKSFVLHGPPGTGKSQTITTLIANALAQEKTVLFVAEKRAALEVVQKRLSTIGIAPFCLELHSNKSKKKDVLEQLRQATEVTKFQKAEEYAAKAEKLSCLRQELDEYADELHKRLSCGLTIYQLINEYEECREAPILTDFSQKLLENMTREALEHQSSLIERLVAAAKAVGHPFKHPLEAVECTGYSQQLKLQLPSILGKYKLTLEKLNSASLSFAASINEASPKSYGDIMRLASISKELTFWLSLPRAWSTVKNINKYMTDVQEMAQHYIAAGTLHSKLTQSWKEGFFALDGKELRDKFNEASSKWFLPRAIALNKLSKRVAAYSIAPTGKKELGNYFEALAQYQNEINKGKELFADYGGDLASLYQGDSTNWEEILDYARKAKNSADTLLELGSTDNLRIDYCGVRELREKINVMNEAWNNLSSSKEALYSLLLIRDGEASEHWIQEQLEICDNIASYSDDIKEWISWRSIASEAVKAGLTPVLEAYSTGMAHEDIKASYRKSISRALIIYNIDKSQVLNSFSGAMFNEKIEQFKRLDKEITALAQKEIFCRLAARVPNFTKEAAQSSELGILQKAIRSGGRGISIRKLFEQIPNLLPRLCPCMLMSPISAAQYLDPKCEPFSIVVFDEASQLPTCKAVGALARGKDAVIVGDPKQMPPTSFFTSNTLDEENLDLEDLDSILDDCLGLNMPQTHLLWHYRSRHESLIAFSNKKFYENKLYTFPSVNDRESKVTLIPVEGVFDRGKTRQNRAEAEAIVEELKRRCYDARLSKMSVGVVTFNISQQNLIDDLLMEACKTDSQLEAWLFQGDEPIFIKNLENVQGDERDVILFSVGYGPDSSGKVYMNFGPLNRDGGWRRLNVAISRARCEMIVFSTLMPDQIDLSKTSSQGVEALKSFLEYASGRELSLDENTSRQEHSNSEGIIDAICTALKSNGYNTQCSVGHSEYRIDVGVIDPEAPERYLLGILLDGPTYAGAKTTRDREIAQISVLKDLGWEIHRIWSMDWWDNSRKEVDKLLSKIQGIKEYSTSTTAGDSVEEVTSEIAGSPSKAVVEAPSMEITLNADLKENGYFPKVLELNYISSEDFMEPTQIDGIKRKIAEVIEHEAPICEGVLTRRIVQSFGIARAGSRIQTHLDGIYRLMKLKYTVQENQKVFWKDDQEPDNYMDFRASGGDNRRDPKEVPVQEAANAICNVLYEQISLSQEDLIREAAKLLGYGRLGASVISLFNLAINHSADKGKIKLGVNGNWILSSDK